MDGGAASCFALADGNPGTDGSVAIVKQVGPSVLPSGRHSLTVELRDDEWKGGGKIGLAVGVGVGVGDEAVSVRALERVAVSFETARFDEAGERAGGPRYVVDAFPLFDELDVLELR